MCVRPAVPSVLPTVPSTNYANLKIVYVLRIYIVFVLHCTFNWCYRTGSTSDLVEHKNDSETLDPTCDRSSHLDGNEDGEMINVSGNNFSTNKLTNKDSTTSTKSRANGSAVSTTGREIGVFSSTFGLTEDETREFWNMLLPTETASGAFTILYYKIIR